MIIYIAVRVFSRLYGLGWPMNEGQADCAMVWSVVEVVVFVLAVCELVSRHFPKKGGAE